MKSGLPDAGLSALVHSDVLEEALAEASADTVADAADTPAAGNPAADASAVAAADAAVGEPAPVPAKADAQAGDTSLLPPEDLARIRRLEALYEEWAEVLPRLQAAQREWRTAHARLQELHHYYFNGEWRSDYEADEAGRLPEDMPRGILCEDTLYNAFIAERSGPERRLKALKIASPATFRALSRYRARGDACAFGWGLQDFRHRVSSSVTE